MEPAPPSLPLRLRHVELYCGVGGASYALAEAGVAAHTVAAYDISGPALDVYAHNFGTEVVRNRNITGLNAGELDAHGADLWTMSPPCQPFTRRGNRRDVADARTDSLAHLLLCLRRMARPPRHVVVENVFGFHASHMRRELVGTLRALGYMCNEYLLTPPQLGVPNSRLRYYLAACRDGQNRPRSTVQDGHVGDCAPGTSLGSLPPLADGYKLPHGSCAVRTVGEYLDDACAIGAEHYLPATHVQKYGRGYDIVFADSAHSCCFTKAYGRVANASAGSLLCTRPEGEFAAAKSDDAGGGFDWQRLASLRPRYFTWREVARLMAFPDAFDCPPSVRRRTMYQLLGNSVNVRVLAAVLGHCLRPDCR